MPSLLLRNPIIRNTLWRCLLACIVLVASNRYLLAASDEHHLPKIIIGSLDCGRKLSLPKAKLEAGFALALQLSAKYTLVSAQEADSISTMLRSQHGNETTASDLAHHVQAQAIAFIRIDRLENILRAEVQLAHAPNYQRKSKGIGYALIRYRSEKKSVPLLDPAILTALQRAFAVVVGDSALYSAQPGAYNVQPAPTLVVGGMEFLNNSSLPPWALFTKTTIQAFDAVVSIFDAIKDSPRFVAYDVDSRDSIFALFRLYVIENDRAPSRQELDALAKLDVAAYITGSCERTEQGAHLKLHLCDVHPNGTYTIRKTEEGDIDNDTVLEFRKAVQELARKLLQ